MANESPDYPAGNPNWTSLFWLTRPTVSIRHHHQLLLANLAALVIRKDCGVGDGEAEGKMKLICRAAA